MAVDAAELGAVVEPARDQEIRVSGVRFDEAARSVLVPVERRLPRKESMILRVGRVRSWKWTGAGAPGAEGPTSGPVAPAMEFLRDVRHDGRAGTVEVRGILLSLVAEVGGLEVEVSCTEAAEEVRADPARLSPGVRELVAAREERTRVIERQAVAEGRQEVVATVPLVVCLALAGLLFVLFVTQSIGASQFALGLFAMKLLLLVSILLFKYGGVVRVLLFGRDPPAVPLAAGLLRKTVGVAAALAAAYALLRGTGVLGTLALAPAWIAASAWLVLARRLLPGEAMGVMLVAGLFLDAFLPCWGIVLRFPLLGGIDLDFWFTEALAAGGGMALAFVVEHEGRAGPLRR